MAQGGSITWRIDLKGAEQVKAALATLGPSGASALRQLEAATAPPTRGLNAISRAAREVGDGLGGMAQRAGPVGRVLGELGPLGAAAAIGLGALAAASYSAIRGFQAAIRFGDELADTSNRIGVSAEFLQTWREAARQVGIDASTATSGIQAFQENIGRVMAGVADTRVMANFRALGFTDQQVRSFHDVEDALEQVLARARQIPDQAERMRLLSAVGLSGMEAMTRLNRSLDDVGDRMSRLTNEEVAQLGDANDTFESLANTVRVELARAFIPVAEEANTARDDINKLIQDLARLASMTVRVFIRISQVWDGAARWGEGINNWEERQAAGPVGEWLANNPHPFVRSVGRAWVGDNQRRRQRINQAEAEARARATNGQLAGIGDAISGSIQSANRELVPTTRTRPPRGGGRSGGRGASGARTRRASGDTAEEIADRREELELRRQLNQAEAERDEVAARRLRDRMAERDLVEQLMRAQYGRPEAERMAAEQIAAQVAARERQVTLEREKEKASISAARAEEELQAAREQDQETQRRRAYWTDHQLQSEIELARLAGDGTRLRALEREAELARRIAEYRDNKDGDPVGRAQGELAAEDRARAIDEWRDVFTGGIRGALSGQEGWLTSFWTSIFDRAADNFANTLWDAISGALNGRSGSAGSGGGGWLGALFNFGGSLLGGGGRGGGGHYGTVMNPWAFAAGTSSAPGGWSWVGERGPELMFVPPGARIEDNASSMRLAGGGKGGGATVYNLQGAVLWPDLWAKIQREVAAGDAQVVGRLQPQINDAPTRTLEIMQRTHGRT